MKSNVFDIRTKAPIPIDEPRQTMPGGIFMNVCDLIESINRDGQRCYLVGALHEYIMSLQVPPKDLRAMILIFDTRNSKRFLVEHMKEMSDKIFEGQFVFE